jgi:hypothetical protein
MVHQRFHYLIVVRGPLQGLHPDSPVLLVDVMYILELHALSFNNLKFLSCSLYPEVNILI